MWTTAVGGLVVVWLVGAVWGWGGEGGSLGIVLPLSLVVGGLSAMVLGATLTIAAYVMLSAKHQVTVRVPAEVPALQAIVAVGVAINYLGNFVFNIVIICF